MENILFSILLVIIGFLVGIGLTVLINHFRINSASARAKDLILAATKEAEKSKRDLLIEAKEESYKLKLDIDS